MSYALRRLVDCVTRLWDKHERAAVKHIVKSWELLIVATVIFAVALWVGHKELGFAVLGSRLFEAMGDVLFDRGMSLD